MYLKLLFITVWSLNFGFLASPVRASSEPRNNRSLVTIKQNLQANGAENFNPSLEVPPVIPIAPPNPKPEEPKESIIPVSKLEKMKLENIQTDFSNEQDNNGQRNQFIQTTSQFRMNNGQKFLFKTGANSFVMPGVESVTNIPFQIGWEGKINTIKIQPSIGIDLFNRLPIAINLHLNAEVPIAPTLTLSVAIDHEPYKSSAKVLENRISSWRYGPSLYWQIDPKTSLFSMYRRGNYNDGNTENLSHFLPMLTRHYKSKNRVVKNNHFWGSYLVHTPK